ncbi:hypothetical protein PB1A_1207 [Leuconostoc inhae]|jgi:hypothetical protein|uniref:hypothetical protein n=1 Tax=Leuconostoc inhae TaxID=178001 RepID=UPI0007E02ED4|nr:hypothetical protein [Leuconostoc inhae]CUW06382.1 hypothetical protein PB1A_1207 [Leuconostoc inhae]
MGKYLEYLVAKNLLRQINTRPDKYMLIHYSSSNSQGNEYPSISSISLMKYDNKDRMQFSIAKYIQLEKTVEDAEKRLLTSFWRYIERISENVTFIHWNMNSETFGFEAIANRTRILLGVKCDQSKHLKKIDLDDLLGQLYSDEYIQHPKMYKLYELNKMTIHDFAKGKQEAEWFNKEEWYKISKASSAKVSFIYETLRRAGRSQLTVENKFLNKSLLFKDCLKYVINETLWGRFIFWFTVTLIGSLISIFLEKLF